MHRCSLQWTSSALNDLGEIREFIQRDKPEAAKKEAARIQKGVEKLRQFPFIGRKLRTIPAIHEIIVSPYHIFYRPTASEVQILRILHGKRAIAFVP